MLNASPGACTYWRAMDGDEAPSGNMEKNICALAFSVTLIGQLCWIGSQD